MGIFSYNGKLMGFLSTFWDIVWVGILWTVCSVPIVTIGAASTAAYYAMSKSVRKGIGHVTKEFFSSFKKNFKQATAATLVYLLIGVVLAADCLFFYYNQSDYALGGRILSYLLVLFYLAAMNLAFPWLSRFHIKTGHLLKYSFSLAATNLPQTIALLTFWVAAVLLAYWAWWSLLFLPGFKCFLDCLILDPLLKKYEPQANPSP